MSVVSFHVPSREEHVAFAREVVQKLHAFQKDPVYTNVFNHLRPPSRQYNPYNNEIATLLNDESETTRNLATFIIWANTKHSWYQLIRYGVSEEDFENMLRIVTYLAERISDKNYRQKYPKKPSEEYVKLMQNWGRGN
jgi:hypothetical protein